MKVIEKTGRDDIAVVYVAETETGKLVEFAESLQPPYPIEKKWILCISMLYGCPVDCRFCDAGGAYEGKLTAEEMLAQIEHLIANRFSNGIIPVEKFKIQFARMGEPSFNNNVLDVLEILPIKYQAPGLLPSFSTIAPIGTDKFFGRLLEIKKKYYGSNFQFQFSIHTTDEQMRRWLIPTKCWDFQMMAAYGKRFHEPGDRKITLNFALAVGMQVDENILLRYFDPELFIIKITPVNPTYKAKKNNILSVLPTQKNHEIFSKLQGAGYEVILSIGELEENYIGSNCGQYVQRYKETQEMVEGGYRYPKLIYS
ncbi:MAG: radical SAM protein [Bacteroidota bacterium]|nr:radical SAM protein [Bacteroidota bacterium]